MDYKNYRNIVLKVLEKHNLSDIDKHHISSMQLGLSFTEDKEFCITSDHRINNIEYKSRVKRIKALEKVIELYELFKKDECFENKCKTNIGSYQSELHEYIYKHSGLDLDELIKNLKKLNSIEVSFLEMYPLENIPNSRPVSGKNEGAKCICSYLIKNNVTLWKSCEIIADMLILAGVENKDKDKVIRALYNKLERADLNSWR
jgi:hypothetical protein